LKHSKKKGVRANNNYSFDKNYLDRKFMRKFQVSGELREH